MMVLLSLSIVIFLARPRSSNLNAFQLHAEIFSDGLAAGQNRDVLQHGLATIAKARSFHCANLQRAAQFVHDQSGQCFAFNIFGDDQQRTAGLGYLLQNGSRSFMLLIFFSLIRIERVIQNGFHALGSVTK